MRSWLSRNPIKQLIPHPALPLVQYGDASRRSHFATLCRGRLILSSNINSNVSGEVLHVIPTSVRLFELATAPGIVCTESRIQLQLACSVREQWYRSWYVLGPGNRLRDIPPFYRDQVYETGLSRCCVRGEHPSNIV